MSTAARYVRIEDQLDDMLLSGGDARLALDTGGLNIYGCASRPRARMDDFSSSTASTISDHAYERAGQSYRRLLRQGFHRFDELVEQARSALKTHLGLGDGDADIVFSPSGTDAQLLALFLVRAILGTPLVSIVAGSDQTGRGTVHTARGRQFIDRDGAKMGQPLEGLAEGVNSVAIPFFDAEGKARRIADLDQAVMDAVEAAVISKHGVLLQAMASSKLGWSAPSGPCLDEIARHWPDRVCIVVDSCQMRIAASRIKQHLGAGHMVLVTGSKFFCGPPFSGALLIPPGLRSAIAAISDVPRGIQGQSTKFDWPPSWRNLRPAFSDRPNIGQWLRWEAALEEMRAYHATPLSFRSELLRRFAKRVRWAMAASRGLMPLDHAVGETVPGLDGEFCAPTIFSFFLGHPKGTFSLAECRRRHQALNAGPRPCHIGQPVAIGPGDRAVLRISSSARLVARCWSSDPAARASRVEDALDGVTAAIARISSLAQKDPKDSGRRRLRGYLPV